MNTKVANVKYYYFYIILNVYMYEEINKCILESYLLRYTKIIEYC